MALTTENIDYIVTFKDLFAYVNKHTLFSLVPLLKTGRVFFADAGYLPDRVRHLRQSVRDNLVDGVSGMIGEGAVTLAFVLTGHPNVALIFGLALAANTAETGFTTSFAFLRQRTHQRTINNNADFFSKGSVTQ